jgi:hypothetical protein
MIKKRYTVTWCLSDGSVLDRSVYEARSLKELLEELAQAPHEQADMVSITPEEYDGE